MGLVGPKSDVWGLYSEIQCIIGNGHMGTPMDRQIPVKTIPSRNFGGKAVKKHLFENPDCN